MQDDDLVAAGEFNNDIEAQEAINMLAENDIVAQINDEGGSFDLGIGELAGIEIIVTQSNLEKAKALLAELSVDEGFFACWSCGNEYEAG